MKAHIPYFSFYPADFMNGVRGMTAQDVGVYTMLLCRIYEESGPVEYNAFRLSTYCGMRPPAFEKTLTKLVELGKLTLTDGMLSNDRADIEISKRAHGLKLASKAGSASAEKRKQKQQNNPTDVQQTFNHTDTDTDTDKKEGEPYGSLVVSRPGIVDQCLEHFNATADTVGWPKVQKMNGPRRAALTQRIKDVGGGVAWREAITRAADSPLLTGQTSRGWRADFDWLCKAANFTKLMEGNYDPATPTTPTADRNPRPAQMPAHRPDPALEQILRLTGLSQAPGDLGH